MTFKNIYFRFSALTNYIYTVHLLLTIGSWYFIGRGININCKFCLKLIFLGLYFYDLRYELYFGRYFLDILGVWVLYYEKHLRHLILHIETPCFPECNLFIGYEKTLFCSRDGAC